MAQLAKCLGMNLSENAQKELKTKLFYLLINIKK